MSLRWAKRATLWHLGVAALVTLFLYAIFTYFSKYIAHPETLSPFVYLAVTVIGLWRVRKLKIAKRGVWKLFTIIPAISLFGFLEEISYGAELGLFTPFEVGDSDLIFQDFHNFVHILLRWIEKEIGLADWQPSVYILFLYANILVLLICLIWLLVVRSQASRQDQVSPKERIAIWFVMFSAFLPLPAILALLLLPRDPKNSLLLGFSAPRLGMMLLLVISMTFWLWIARLSRSRPAWLRKMKSSKQSWVGWRRILSGVLIVYLVFQAFVSFAETDQVRVSIERILPLLSWTEAQIALMLVGLIVLEGGLQRSLGEYFERFQLFGHRRPAFVYVFVAVALAVFAQALDRDYVMLPVTTSTVEFLNRDWHIWTEELFEMIAAVQLGIASLLIQES